MSYRELSYWMSSLDEDVVPRPALDCDLDVDVAIVGAGYTGLWTAYYLISADPSMRIAVLEAPPESAARGQALVAAAL